MRGEVFSIGFGPELLGWTDRTGTRWKFSAVPLGGYVKMFGDADAASMPGGDKLAAMTDAEREVSFHHKRLGQRAAVLLRLPMLFASRTLVFDDGVYGVSVIDMRHGLAPYRGVFSAQGPLHFPLLYAGDLLSFHSIDGPRVHSARTRRSVATRARWCRSPAPSRSTS